MTKKSISEKELEFLFPETEVEIAGHTFALRPFSFSETVVVAEKLKGVLGILAEGEVTATTMATIYATSYEGIRDIMAMCLDIKPDLVDKFDQESALIAITSIIAVNKDFFVLRVKSTMDDLVNQVMPTIEQ